MISVQTLRDTKHKDKVYHINNCDKVCLICGYHTHESNASNQQIHNYCMNEYSNYVEELRKVKSCSICGNTKRKLIENTCNKCLKSIF